VADVEQRAARERWRRSLPAFGDEGGAEMDPLGQVALMAPDDGGIVPSGR
jgi:hypothetical protein